MTLPETPCQHPSWLTQTPRGTVMRLHIQPRASRSEIVGEHGEGNSARLRIRISSPPVEGAANEALIRVLGEVTGISRGHIRIIRGATSRSKDVLFEEIAMLDIVSRIALPKGTKA